MQKKPSFRKFFRSRNIGRTILLAVMTGLSAVMLVPVLVALFNSVKLEQEILSANMTFFPRAVHWDNYDYVFRHAEKYYYYFKNSIVITVSSVIITVVTSSLAGYAFAKLPFRGRDGILGFLLFLVTFPLAVLLIPIYIMEYDMGLINKNLGLILPCVATVVPFCVFIMRGVFKEVPDELQEAATIDGCSVFQTFLRIMVPAAKGGLAIVVIFSFYNVWGEYTLSRALATNDKAMPISVGVVLLKGEGGWQYGVLGAVITIALIPPIAMFMKFQKHLVSGVLSGAIKG